MWTSTGGLDELSELDDECPEELESLDEELPLEDESLSEPDPLSKCGGFGLA